MPHLVRNWAGRISAAFSAMLVVALCAGGAVADAYTVTGVKVQATSSKPEAARTKAVGEGEAVAFSRLLRRMTLPEDHTRLPKPAADVVRGMIRNFSIENESGEGGRYTASVAYQFDREAIRALLEGAGIPFVDAPSPPVVVLPVWTDGGKQYLWDDPNPWREAWLRHEAQDLLVDFVRLRGDLDDLKAVSAEEAASAKSDALDRIAGLYKAGLVAVAVVAEEKGKRRIAVQIVDLANKRATPVGTLTVGDASGAPAEGALDKAAAEIARAIDAAWKRTAVAAERNAAIVRLRTPIRGLEQWVQIRQSLQGIPQLRSLKTVSMSVGEALVELRFAGTSAELRRQLEQLGYTVAPETGTPAAAGPEVWLVTAPSAPPIKQTDLPPQEAQPPSPPAKDPDTPPAEPAEPPKKP